MKLIYFLLILALVLNPAGCAILGCATSNKPMDEPTVQQEEEGVTVGTYLKMVGYLCLFGLFSSPPATETEYVTDISGEAKTFNPARSYRIDKKKDGGTK